MKKECCPAYGTTCNQCSGKNHFASMCKKGQGQSQVCHVDDNEELLTINTDRKRLFSHLSANGRAVRFLLDCGATVNLLPMNMAEQINPGLTRLSPSKSTLRMSDSTALQTAGMLQAQVQHPVTGQEQTLDFYVALKHNQLSSGSTRVYSSSCCRGEPVCHTCNCRDVITVHS
jgi:hypothetical protein